MENSPNMCVIEWCCYTLIALETGSFTVLNTELEDLFVVKYVAYIHPSSFTIISVKVHIKSAINVHTVVANINVTVHMK